MRERLGRTWNIAGMVIEKLLRNQQLTCQAGITEYVLNKAWIHMLK